MSKQRKERILLIGFRGCGKSTIGRRLAKELGWNYISTDRRVEEKGNMAIGEIVRRSGWEYFRKLEGEVLDALETSRNSVIDTGGGALIEHRKGIEKLLNYSMVVWIDAHLDDIVRRLKGDKNRPLLSQKNLIEDVEFNYDKRRPTYQKLATHTFNTSVESVEEICNKIIREMRRT